jgi:hypothetical protein
LIFSTSKIASLLGVVKSWWLHIDWDATGSMLQGIGGLLAAFAVVRAAHVGQQTLDSWRQQKIASRHIKQAERILKAVYQAHWSILKVNNSLKGSLELSAAEEIVSKKLDVWRNLSDDEKRRHNERQADLTRIAMSESVYEKLVESVVVAKALLHRHGLATQLEVLLNEFSYVRNAAAWRAEPNSGANPFSKPNDEIASNIETAVKEIETICREILDLQK